MAIEDQIIQTFNDSITLLMYAWPFIILGYLFLLKIIWKKWPVDVVIIERRGNNLIKTNDRAGKYIDSYTGITGYKLQKSKDTIPVINYDWVMHNVAVHNTIFDRLINLLRGNIGTLFLFRYGAKQYKPIYITHNNQRKMIWKQLKDKNNQPILLKVYEQFDPRKFLGALEFAVIDWDNMNFMVQEQRASFERRQKKGNFWKQVVVPLAIIIVTALVCIIMFKFSYDYAIALKGSSSSNLPEAPKATAPKVPIIGNLIPGK